MSKKRILVYYLDDSALDLEAVKNALESIRPKRISVRTFLEYGSLLEKLRIETPNFVIVDRALEGSKLDGFEVTKLVKKSHPHLLVFMYTNYLDKEALEKAKKYGLDDISSKLPPVEARVHHQLRLYTDSLREKIVKDKRRKPPKFPLPLIGSTMRHFQSGLTLFLDNKLVFGRIIQGPQGTGKSFALKLAYSTTKKEDKKLLITSPVTDIEALSNLNGWWVFIDDLDRNISVDLQAEIAKLVGSGRMRVMATTSQPLSNWSKPEIFDQTLIELLSYSRCSFPPLRERVAELPEYIDYFYAKLPDGPYVIPDKVMNMLMGYDYQQGNISELSSIINLSRTNLAGRTITTASLPDELLQKKKNATHYKRTPIRDVREITIKVSFSDPNFSFEQCEDKLLVQVVRELALVDKINGRRTSFRTLNKPLGWARDTLAKRLHSLVERELITPEELNSWKGNTPDDG